VSARILDRVSQLGVGLICFYFAASIATLVISNVVFMFWLMKRGANVSFFWSGTPGYLSRVYLKWCAEHDREPGGWVPYMRILMINAVIAIVIFAVMMPTFTKERPAARRSNIVTPSR
jgi:hypothetical protein